MSDIAKKCYDTAIRYEGGESHGILIRAGDTILSLMQKNEYLQRKNAMLIESLREHIEYTDHSTGSGLGRELHNKAAIAYFADSGQSAEWLEASHIEWMKKLEPVAHMYPSDLEKFQSQETFAQAFSVAVGCPDETSVPLYLLPTKKAAVKK